MTAEAKGYSVDLVGELAAMLELGLGPENKKPALDEAGVFGVYRSSVKVVAGNRIWPLPNSEREPGPSLKYSAERMTVLGRWR